MPGDSSYQNSDGIAFIEANVGLVRMDATELSSDERSEIGSYFNAVSQYLGNKGSDPTGYGISQFAGYAVGGHYFETDLYAIQAALYGNEDIFIEGIYLA